MNRSVGAIATLAIVVLILVLTGTALASPQPVGVCGSCDNLPVDDVEYENASVTVQVAHNGSSQWTERVTVDAESAQKLRDATGAVDQNSSGNQIDATTGPWERVWANTINKPTTINTEVDGQTVIVRYRVMDSATVGYGGTILFTPLLDHYWAMDADSLTVRGPPNTTVANDPTRGTVEGDAVVFGRLSRGSDTYIAFAPSDGLLADISVTATIASEIGLRMIINTLFITWLPITLLFIAAMVLTIGHPSSDLVWPRRSRSNTDRQSLLSRVRSNPPLLVGWGFLVLLRPFLWAFGLNTIALAVLAITPVILWLALGLARTSSVWWLALIGIVLVPITVILPSGPIGANLFNGYVYLLLIGFGVSMVWILLGILAFVLGRKLRGDHPTESSQM